MGFIFSPNVFSPPFFCVQSSLLFIWFPSHQPWTGFPKDREMKAYMEVICWEAFHVNPVRTQKWDPRRMRKCVLMHCVTTVSDTPYTQCWFHEIIRDFQPWFCLWCWEKRLDLTVMVSLLLVLGGLNEQWRSSCLPGILELASGEEWAGEEGSPGACPCTYIN